MGWETRRNARRYFYKTIRLPDGRTTKKYFGCGERAHLEEARIQERAEKRQRFLAEMRQVGEVEAISRKYVQMAQAFIEHQMRLAGFSNPRSRGWRRSTKNVVRSTQIEP